MDFNKQRSEINKMRFLINYAILAPSSHNSQPWKFQITGNEIYIRADMTRSLQESDKNNRQLYISLGCALENLLIAADYFGYKTSITYLPNQSDKLLAARVLVTNDGFKPVRESHLLNFITKRHANRNKYIDKPLDQFFIANINSLSTDDLKVDIIIDKKKKDKIANAVTEAGITATADKGFRKELSHYVKNNYTNSPIGMPLCGFGVPWPISFVAPFMMKFVNMNKVNAKVDIDVLKNHTPAFLIISTKEDTQRDWIKTGQTYEKIALESERLDISTAPNAAAIQIGGFYKTLQEILRTNYRPQFFARLGYAEKIMRHSPRINPAVVIKVE